MTIEALPRPFAVTRPLRRKAATGTGLNSAAGHLVMVLLSIFCLFPVYWMLVTSVRPENALFETSLWPTAFSLDNYRYALDTIPIVRMLANTLFVSVVVTVIQLATGLLAAYAFARWRFPFDKLVYGAVALTWLVPFQVVMIPTTCSSRRWGCSTASRR